MQKEQVNNITLLILVGGISVLFLTMIHQFLMAIFLAGLFAALASPIHRWLTVRLGGRKNLASLLTLGIIICLVLVPLAILVTIVISQAIAVGQSVSPWVQAFLKQPSVINGYLHGLPYYDQLMPYRDLLIQKGGVLVANLSAYFIDSLSQFTRMTVNLLFSGAIMLYVMFYFLSMGSLLLEKILYFLPLEDQEERLLLERFTSVTRATIKTTFFIGLLQGCICGVGFALASLPAAVFWGTVMAVMSIIPAFGTAIIWGPALLILALKGDFGGVVILLVLCGGVAGNLDNFLRPRLVGKDTQMHDLFVLFGTLGGISMFGLLGIVIGPIIAALFITIWEIYGKAFASYLPAVGNYSGWPVEEPAGDKAHGSPSSTSEGFSEKES